MRTTHPLLLAAAVATTAVAAAGVAHADTPVERPGSFTSAFTVMATPDRVFNANREQVPGEAGATGTFTFQVNSELEVICYDITLRGVTPPYMSMARTATHIHQAGAGAQGPPRISFPDPAGDGGTLTSAGCVRGPFTTGIEGPDGRDTGAGFTLAQLEADPANFYADTHTERYVAGAVRGQLAPVPVGGVEAGVGVGGAPAERGGAPAAAAASALLLGLLTAAVVVRRRRARG